QGKPVTLIDTPGFFDTCASEELFKMQLAQCFTQTAPGPHAILIVLKVERYTAQEQDLLEKISQYFSEEAFKFAIVVFTYGDQLEPNQTIEDFVQPNQALRNLVQKCGGRCHVVDNKHWNKPSEDKMRSNDFQVAKILSTVDSIVKANNNGYYTNDIFQKVMQELEREEERIRQTATTEMSQTEIRSQARNSIYKLLLINSLANTILGVENLFTVSDKSVSETSVCQSETGNIYNKTITLVDTPGVFDTNPRSNDLSPELLRCLLECAPGPHAFLLVLKVERFTKQEQAVVDLILKYFSEEALKYTTLVFTNGDQLKKGVTIKEWAIDNEALSTLIQKCGGRCHVFDNKQWNNSQDPYRNNQHQIRELLKTIDQTVQKNGGTCYTNEMLTMINEDIQEEVRNNSASSNLAMADIWQRAKEVVYNKLMRNMEGALTGSMRIILLGKTGSGKSSLGNTILGEDFFKTDDTPNSGTKQCQSKTKSVNGKNITLIDTPGLFDSARPEEELMPEILSCFTESTPGPHAFIILLKVEKFTTQEQAIITKICQYFSKEALQYATVVFTHGDQLPSGMNIETFIKQNKGLSELVQKCGNRCHVVDNSYWNDHQSDQYRSNQYQVEELLETIEEMVKSNNWGYYTNKAFKTFEKDIEKEMEEVSKE
ncbi:hypothetical protein NQD34_013495, partial [Periophthalmus magnuspinnatus]